MVTNDTMSIKNVILVLSCTNISQRYKYSSDFVTFVVFLGNAKKKQQKSLHCNIILICFFKLSALFLLSQNNVHTIPNLLYISFHIDETIIGILFKNNKLNVRNDTLRLIHV